MRSRPAGDRLWSPIPGSPVLWVSVLGALVVGGVLAWVAWRQRQLHELAQGAAVYAYDWADPRMKAQLEAVHADEAKVRPPRLHLRDLLDGGAYGTAGVPAEQLLILAGDGTSVWRTAESSPFIYFGRWTEDGDHVEVTTTHHLNTPLDAPGVFRGTREGDRILFELVAPEDLPLLVVRRLWDGIDCTCERGQRGEAVWCIQHDRGFVDGRETTFWPEVLAAHWNTSCARCVAEARRVLAQGDLPRGLALLRRAGPTPIKDRNLRFLIAQARGRPAAHHYPLDARPWAEDRSSEACRTWGPAGGIVFDLDDKGDLVVRDALTGGVRARVGPPSEVWPLGIGPQGRFLATEDAKGVTLWELAEGLTALGHVDPLPDSDSYGRILFSGDGSRFTLPGALWIPRPIWDLPSMTGHAPPRLEGQTALHVLALDRHGESVVAKTRTGALFLLDVEDGRVVASCPDAQVEEFDAVVSPEDRKVAFTFPGARLWTPGSKERPANLFEIHFHPAREWPVAAAFAVGDTRLALRFSLDDPPPGAPSSYVVLFDLLRRDPVDEPGEVSPSFAILEGHRASLQGQSVSPDGLRLATFDAAGRVFVWDARTGAHLATFEAHAHPVRFAVFSPDGRHLVSGDSTGDVCVQDVSLAEAVPPDR